MTTDVAEVTHSASQENTQTKMAVFALSGCLFGVVIPQVLEIIRLIEVTLIPKTPAFLEGIIYLRGKIIPVMDLKKRFGMPLLEYTPESRILIVDWKGQTMGLLVDRVLEIARISPADIAPVAEPILDINETFFLGRFQLREQMVLLLNLENVFWSERWKMLPEEEFKPQEESTLGLPGVVRGIEVR